VLACPAGIRTPHDRNNLYDVETAGSNASGNLGTNSTFALGARKTTENLTRMSDSRNGNRSSSYSPGTDCTEDTTSNSYSIVGCVSRTCHCLATLVFAETFPINDCLLASEPQFAVSPAVWNIDRATSVAAVRLQTVSMLQNPGLQRVPL
jgi:hypothetical protein